MNPLSDAESRPRARRSLPELQQESLLQEYASLIARGKWTVIITLAVVWALTAYYTFTVEPVYEASSLVLVDMRGREGGLPVFDIVGTAAANKITNELEALKSNANGAAVARTLMEKRRLDDASPGLLKIVTPDENAAATDSLASEATVVRRLLYAVDFTPIRESDIIRITVRSTDPREAAFVANIYTDVYTTRNLRTSRMRSQALREFLQTQLLSKRTVLDTTENELQQYMRRSGVVTLDAEANSTVQQLSLLEAQRDAMLVELSSRQKTLSSYKDELVRHKVVDLIGDLSLAGVPKPPSLPVVSMGSSNNTVTSPQETITPPLPRSIPILVI